MIFEKGKDWIDEIISVTKIYNNTKDSSAKLTPIRASLKKNEYIYKNLKTKEKIKPKFKLGVFGRTADKTNVFFQKVIQQIEGISCKHLQKLIMI